MCARQNCASPAVTSTGQPLKMVPVVAETRQISCRVVTPPSGVLMPPTYIE